MPSPCRAALLCPHCGGSLAPSDGALRCPAGHSFDVARQGYVNLTGAGTHTGTADTRAMVAARQAFLASGHFRPLLDAVATAAAEAAHGVPGCLIDAGGGTGEYLAAALDRMPEREGLVLDLSKDACKHAARLHPRMSAVVADTWRQLPLAGGSAAVVLNVFAPRNAAEFARVLAPGGAVVTVTPNAAHLGELVAALGLVTVDARKEERLEEQLGTLFERERSTCVERTLALTREEAALVVGMGPSARHLEMAELDACLAALGEPVRTTLSATVSVWRKRP